jgi:hypothetical protein
MIEPDYENPESENLCFEKNDIQTCEEPSYLLELEQVTDRGFFIQACPEMSDETEDNQISLTFIQDFLRHSEEEVTSLVE